MRKSIAKIVNKQQILHGIMVVLLLIAFQISNGLQENYQSTNGVNIQIMENFDFPLNNTYDQNSYTTPVNDQPVYVSNGSLVLEEFGNAYAHAEVNISQYSILETKVRVVSGKPGGAWGPGIGLWINGSFAFHYGIGHEPEALRFSYTINGVEGHSYLPVSVSYGKWLWLKLNLTAPENVDLEYSFDGYTWLDFNVGSIVASGEDLTTLSFPSVFKQGGLLIVGKGLPAGRVSTVGTDEFDTYFSGGVGSLGISEIDYYKVSLLTDTTPEPTGTDSTTSPTTSNSNELTTSVIDITKSPPPSASEPSLVFGFQLIIVLPMLLIRAVIHRRLDLKKIDLSNN